MFWKNPHRSDVAHDPTETALLRSAECPWLRRRLSLAVALLMVAGTLVGFGPINPGSMSPAGLAMGGVGVASGASTTALYTNPAGLAAHRAHNFEFGFSRDRGFKRSSFFVQSADGQAPGFVQGGSSFAYESGTLPDGRTRTGYDVRGGLAFAGSSDVAQMMIGLTTRYMDIDYGKSATIAKRSITGWTGDLGMTVAFTGNLRLGFVWRNVLALDPVEAPERLAGGIAVVLSGVIVAVDGSWGVDTPGTTYRAGAAVNIGESFQLRGGYIYSELGTFDAAATGPAHWASGGFGFRFGRYSVDAALALDVARPAEMQLTVALNFYMPKLRGR